MYFCFDWFLDTGSRSIMLGSIRRVTSSMGWHKLTILWGQLSFLFIYKRGKVLSTITLFRRLRRILPATTFSRLLPFLHKTFLWIPAISIAGLNLRRLLLGNKVREQQHFVLFARRSLARGCDWAFTISRESRLLETLDRSGKIALRRMCFLCRFRGLWAMCNSINVWSPLNTLLIHSIVLATSH